MGEVISRMREGVIVISSDLTFIYMNEAATKIGLSKENVIGKSLFEVFPRLKKENSTILKVLKTGKPILGKIQTFVTYRGERKTALTSTHPILKDEKVIAIIEIFEDISALNNLTEQVVALQEKNKKIKLLDDSREPVQASTEFIGEDPSIREIKMQIPILAASPSPVFIFGETGTGKEVIVQKIHECSSPKQIPLITQNCAAIPENLLESILFGTVKGSFTDAVDRKGLFELADGGILFLDEINSLSKSLQAKLLRVLQEKKVRRVGSAKEIPVTVRFIAASNVHPQELLKSGEIRADLYYRLNVMYLELPPLRERKEDILLLASYFIASFNKLFHKDVRGLSKEAEQFFLQYEWPGNIRELKNMVERAMNLTQTAVIKMDHLQPTTLLSAPTHEQTSPSMQKTGKTLKEAIRELEIDMIMKELKNTRGNISQAARNLDIPQQTLSHKIKRYQMHPYIYQVKSLNFE
jgi:arginine utilization regulatory protein